MTIISVFQITDINMIYYVTAFKCFTPTLIKLLEISIFSTLLQTLNVDSPILVTLSGTSMPVRLLQPENAASPILVTLSGIMMLARLL